MAIYGFCVPRCGKLVSEVLEEQAAEITQLKEANATAQKLLAAKQAVVDQACKERDNLKACNKNQAEQVGRLSAEVAKLKGDLAQKDSDWRAILLLDIAELAETGKDCGRRDCSSMNAVRKLRADYEVATARNEMLAGECWGRAVSEGSLRSKIRAAVEALA